MERTEQLQDFYDRNPWAEVDANDSFILAKMAALNLTIEQAVSTLGFQITGGSLLVHPVYKQSWDSFTTKHSEFKGSGTAGNMLVAFNALNDHEPPTVAAFEEIAGRGLLAESNDSMQATADLREIEELKQQITKGKSSFESYNRWNVRTMFPSKDLESMSLDELRALATKVEGERNLQALPPDQRRKAIKSASAYQAPAVRELPPTFVTTVESRWFAAGQVVPLDALGFLRSGREDQKILLEKHSVTAIQALIDKFKESQK
jgi:hypothetical protein